MTFLRTQKLIKPSPRKQGPKKVIESHYEFQLEIVVELNGMLLDYTVNYPSEGGTITVGKGQVCISAAFVPGCA